MDDKTLGQIAWVCAGVAGEGVVMWLSRRYKWSEPLTYMIGGVVGIVFCLAASAAIGWNSNWSSWRHVVNMTVPFVGVFIWFAAAVQFRSSVDRRLDSIKADQTRSVRDSIVAELELLASGSVRKELDRLKNDPLEAMQQLASKAADAIAAAKEATQKIGDLERHVNEAYGKQDKHFNDTYAAQDRHFNDVFAKHDQHINEQLTALDGRAAAAINAAFAKLDKHVEDKIVSRDQKLNARFGGYWNGDLSLGEAINKLEGRVNQLFGVAASSARVDEVEHKLIDAIAGNRAELDRQIAWIKEASVNTFADRRRQFVIVLNILESALAAISELRKGEPWGAHEMQMRIHNLIRANSDSSDPNSYP